MKAQLTLYSPDPDDDGTERKLWIYRDRDSDGVVLQIQDGELFYLDPGDCTDLIRFLGAFGCES